MTDKLFPILVPDSVLRQASVGDVAELASTAIVCAIPWDKIAPHEMAVRRNHKASLKRLAERGGLDAREAVAAIFGRTEHWPEANLRLHRWLSAA